MPGHRRKRLGLAAPGNGSWEQFKPENTAAVVHGGYSPRLIEPLAQRIVADLFAGGEIPPYLNDPAFASQIRAWARAEAEVALVHEWLQGLPPEQRLTPPKPGTAPPVETWRKLEAHAANLRKDLGLTPMAKAKLGRQLTPVVDVAALMARMADEEGDDGAA